MVSTRIILGAVTALGLAACEAGPRGEAVTGTNPPGATAMRCAPYVGETPTTISGARIVNAVEVAALANSPRRPVLIDVASSETRRSLPGAVWLPGAGACDRDAPAMQARFEGRIAQLTESDRARLIVLLCPNRNCWLSYNATLRLARAGYTDLVWFRDGTEGWAQNGGRLDPVERGW